MRLTLRRLKAMIEKRELAADDEAKLFGRLWKMSKGTRAKRRVFLAMRQNGARWDSITRSLSYFNVFEETVKQGFDELWIEGKSCYGKQRPRTIDEYDKEYGDGIGRRET